jgi:sugar phosphate permease
MTRRWRIVALLSAGVLVNYIDRLNLSVAHDALTNSFHIGRSGFGLLLSAYNLTYCMRHLPMALVLDRFGLRQCLGIVPYVVH